MIRWWRALGFGLVSLLDSLAVRLDQQETPATAHAPTAAGNRRGLNGTSVRRRDGSNVCVLEVPGLSPFQPDGAAPVLEQYRCGYGGPVIPDQDRWAQWLLRRRDAGDDRVQRHDAVHLAGYRDAVLDRAAVSEGDVLLDVGTGSGLIGFAALDRVGPAGQVIFSDISASLLAECRRRAAAQGLLERCRFRQAGAEDLREIADGSVDVVTTRSVLIYVERKQTSFAEFFRVLRSGGRLSLFEPINSFAMNDTDCDLFGVDVVAIADLVAKVHRAFANVPAERDPMLNFDERDLLRWARMAGFAALELDYRAEVEVPLPLLTDDWDVLKRTAPNPLAPTYDEAMTQTLTGPERDRFEDHMRTVLATGAPARKTLATAYLRAIRP